MVLVIQRIQLYDGLSFILFERDGRYYGESDTLSVRTRDAQTGDDRDHNRTRKTDANRSEDLSNWSPLFVLREFDNKVLRMLHVTPPSMLTTSPQFKITGNNEQAQRASVRTATLKLKLKICDATEEEIRVLKDEMVIGRRAPTASLLDGYNYASTYPH